MTSANRHIIRNCTALLALLLLVWACKDPYVNPYKAPATGYLVVEGYISGNTPSRFTLTRSIPLPGDSVFPTENDATVQIQGSDNSTYPLIGQGNGIYSTVDTLNLDTQLEYRLSIKLSNSNQYLSDFVPYKPTPPIDSINWVQNADNSIEIYANAHDPTNNTRYYQWNFDQTYEYHSGEETDEYWDKEATPPAVETLLPQDEVFKCWMSGSSSDIILGTSIKLASDVIYRQPVKYIPPNDIQTSVLYTILVRQYSLTADGYNFLSLMQQNTESLGSIFDAQPSQLTGNIHSTTNPAEKIIGWVSAGTVHSQRLFINRYQISTVYSYSCPAPDTLLQPKDLPMDYGQHLYWPIEYTTLPSGKSGWLSNSAECLVCTLRGGTNQAPSFWPPNQ